MTERLAMRVRDYRGDWIASLLGWHRGESVVPKLTGIEARPLVLEFLTIKNTRSR